MNGGHPDIDTLPLVSALNLTLMKHAQRTGVRVSKNKYFFPSSSEHHTLSLGVEAFRGFFMSVRPMYKQLTVNVNICMTAFYVPGRLDQRMDEFSQQTRGNIPHSFFERLKVSTKHLGFTRKYTIHRVMTGKTARTERFNCEEFKGMISVEDFFKRSTSLRFPLCEPSGQLNAFQNIVLTYVVTPTYPSSMSAQTRRNPCTSPRRSARSFQVKRTVANWTPTRRRQ